MTIPIEKKNMDAVCFFKRITIMPFFFAPIYACTWGSTKSIDLLFVQRIDNKPIQSIG